MIFLSQIDIDTKKQNAHDKKNLTLWALTIRFYLGLIAQGTIA